MEASSSTTAPDVGKASTEGTSGDQLMREQAQADISHQAQQDEAMPDVDAEPTTNSNSTTTKPDEPAATSTSTTTPTIESASTTTATTNTDAPPLSKNALKRQRREQAWLEKKAERKALQKQKRKETQARKHAQQQQIQSATSSDAPTGSKRKAEDDPESCEAKGDESSHTSPSTTTALTTTTNTHKKVRPTPTIHPITILLDCSFDDLMTPKEIISLSSQITRCYADNRLSQHQFRLSITSLNKRLLHRMETSLHNHHKNWKRVSFSSDDYPVTPEDISSGNLIYLTSDSDDTLTELEDGKTYIVGGIVDRNRHKGICYRKAVAQGIRTAKLPIGEYIRMSSRFVLTTNQVVEIMLRWMEVRDWEKAFLKVIPQRKQPKPKEDGGSGKGEGSVKGEQEEEDGEGEREGEEQDEKDDEEEQKETGKRISELADDEEEEAAAQPQAQAEPDTPMEESGAPPALAAETAR